MTSSNGLNDFDKSSDGVRVLDGPGNEDNWHGRNHPDGSTEQISYFDDKFFAIDAVSDKPYVANYARVVCKACGAKSLHTLYTGYNFVERICEICGAINEKSQTNQYGRLRPKAEERMRVL